MPMKKHALTLSLIAMVAGAGLIGGRK